MHWEYLLDIDNQASKPVAVHFKSPSRFGTDDLSVTGIRQCFSSSASRTQMEIKLILEMNNLHPLGTQSARVNYHYCFSHILVLLHSCFVIPSSTSHLSLITHHLFLLFLKTLFLFHKSAWWIHISPMLIDIFCNGY